MFVKFYSELLYIYFVKQKENKMQDEEKYSLSFNS